LAVAAIQANPVLQNLFLRNRVFSLG